MTRFYAGAVAAFFALALAVPSADDKWPQFRGAQAGVAADDRVAGRVGTSQNVVWKTTCRADLELACGGATTSS